MHVASKTVADKYPYVMIQPCMSNRKENKVACFQGQPMHICSIKRGGNDNSKKISKTDNEKWKAKSNMIMLNFFFT